jgi:hypothetical protein
MSRVSAKSKILSYLSKTSGYNTLSAAQATARFGIRGVSAVISQLRNEGYAIYKNVRRRANGTKVYVYRLGTPSASFTARCLAMGVTPKGAN